MDGYISSTGISMDKHGQPFNISVEIFKQVMRFRNTGIFVKKWLGSWKYRGFSWQEKRKC